MSVGTTKCDQRKNYDHEYTNKKNQTHTHKKKHRKTELNVFIMGRMAAVYSLYYDYLLRLPVLIE